MERLVKSAGLSTFAILVAWLVACGCSTLRQGVPLAKVDMEAKPAFAGNLLVASDADQNASAYGDGVLGRVPGISDSLTVVHWDSLTEQWRQGRVAVSNSVVSWPSVIAQSADGRFAYVAETKGQASDGVQKVKNVFRDLPDGQSLTVLDLKDPLKPVVVQKKEVPLAMITVNAKGDLLVGNATSLYTNPQAVKGRELSVATLRNGLIDQVYSFPGLPTTRKGNYGGGASTPVFHPNRDIFALNHDNRMIAFYEVVRSDGGVDSIRLIGMPVAVGRTLSVMNWTPDGRFLLVSDTNWKEGNLGGVTNRPGKLYSIRFSPEGRHKLVAEAGVGLSPEGFDISPDGKLAVVSNMRRTYVPKSLPIRFLIPARKISSLSLVQINPETGALQTLGEYGFEGALPEDAVFDLKAQTVAVAIYQNLHEAYPKQGYVEFWKVISDSGVARLVRTGHKLAVTRGPHTLKVVRPASSSYSALRY